MGSTEDENYLASDAEREAALAELRQSAVEGRIGLEEYLRGSEQLDAATTRAALVAVTSKLDATALPAPKLRRRWWVPFGNRVHRGRFVLAERTRAFVGMGEIHLDLRGATLVGPSPMISLVVVVGTLRLLVPSGISVEVDQSSMYGGRKLVRYGAPPDPRRPTVRVRMVHVFGNVHVTDDPEHWSPIVVPAHPPAETWTPAPLPPRATGHDPR